MATEHRESRGELLVALRTHFDFVLLTLHCTGDRCQAAWVADGHEVEGLDPNAGELMEKLAEGLSWIEHANEYLEFMEHRVKKLQWKAEQEAHAARIAARAGLGGDKPIE